MEGSQDEILTALSCSRYQEQELMSADSRHLVKSVTEVYVSIKLTAA